MRIAVISDAVLETPHPAGHGLGRIVSQVAEGLHRRGHDVTLFAKKGSTFSGKLIAPEDAKGYEGELALAREVMREHRANLFDAILDSSHIHRLSDLFPDLPVVNVYQDSFQSYQRCPVLMSEGQKTLMNADFENAPVVYNAVDAAVVPMGWGGNYALFAGAISDIKQPLLAMEACARMNIPLVMVGGGATYTLRPSGNEGFRYLGASPHAKVLELMRHARVFLQLGTHESFGLTTVEANLSGTPVVAWSAGGSLDIIQYGTNGVFVSVMGKDSIQNVCDAIDRCWYIDREQCRRYAEARFGNVDAQIDAYETLLGRCAVGEWWN